MSQTPNEFNTPPHPATAPGAVAAAPSQSNGWGLAGFIVSLVSIFTCGVVAPIGLILSIVGLFKQPKGFAIAGTIIGGVFSLIGLLIGGSMIMGIMLLRDTGGIAQQGFIVGFARQQVPMFYHNNGRLPDAQEFDQLIVNAQAQFPPQLTSILGNIEVDYRYEQIDATSFRLDMAGPDKKLDTNDDTPYVIDVTSMTNVYKP